MSVIASRRITVNLNVKSEQAMKNSMRRTGRSKTETVNIALGRNDFFEQHLERGIFIENSDGELERIHLL